MKNSLSILRFIFIALVLIGFSELYTQTSANWTAYNDLAWGTGQLEGNITKISSPTGGSGFPSSGELRKFSDNSLTGVTLTISGGEYVPGSPSYHAEDGRISSAGDAAIFNGNISPKGAIAYYNAASPSGDLVLTFSGMNNNKLYKIIFYADRNGYTWDRASLVTISGDNGFENQSSIGTDNLGNPLFSDITDPSTRLPSDNSYGYIAKYNNIRSGSDGIVLLTISFDGLVTQQYKGKYASALMVEEFNPQTSLNWTAYNDLAWGSGQLEGNITKITSPIGGSGYPSSGELRKYSDNSTTGVTLAITGGEYIPGSPNYHAEDGRQTAVGDASIFNGIISPKGAIAYVNAGPPEGNLVLTFSGMNINKFYKIVFYADRNGYSWDRASLVTISGDNGFINLSSDGTDNNTNPLFSGPPDPSTRLPSDNSSGYVARYTNINPGSDGIIVLTISFDGVEEQQYKGKYASALMVEEYSMSMGGTITRESPNSDLPLIDFAELKVRLNGFSEAQNVSFFIKDYNSSSCKKFRWIGLGDTQFYTDRTNEESEGSHSMFTSQTDWIVDNRTSSFDGDIVYVYHVGDIIENNETNDKNDVNKYLDPYEYNIASAELYKLDNSGIPCGLELAGHDRRNKFPTADDFRAIYFNQYFGVDNFYGYPYYGGNYNGGVKGENNNNHYDLISAGGMDFIIVYLEHDNHRNPNWPTDAQINWADSKLKQFSDRRAVVVSHHILAEQPLGQYNTGEFADEDGFRPGKRIYEGLKGNPNLFLMFCGHVCPIGGTSEYRRSDTFNGNVIHTIVANFQDFVNGGDGWFRILTFNPENNTIYFQTFTHFNTDRYRTGDMSQFILSYAEYLNLGTVLNVGEGQSVSHTFNILNSGCKYEWYVEATSPATGVKTTSDKWTFTYNAPTTHILNIKALLLGLFDGSAMVPDDIIVELRNTIDYGLLESKSITLNSLGEGMVNFSSVTDNTPFYIVLKHRNSIETWSKFWQYFNNGALSYDYTDSQNKAYGKNLKLKGNKWCIYGGEIANNDQYIDGDDVTAAFNAQGLSGYVIQDLTGDNYVDGDDVTLIFNNQGVGKVTP